MFYAWGQEYLKREKKKKKKGEFLYNKKTHFISLSHESQA